MKKNIILPLLILSISFIYSCKQAKEKINSPIIELKQGVKYNSQFSITKDSILIVHPKDSIDLKKEKTKRLIVFSTGHFAYLEALNQEKLVQAFPKLKYIYGQENWKKNTIDLGDSESIDMEKIIQINPDLVVLYSSPKLLKLQKQLKKYNIKSIVVDEYKAKSPLAQSEWIRFFGALTHQSKKANRLFDMVEKNYIQTKKNALANPKVFCGIMYGDNWFAPSKNSHISQLIKDAGGDYIFKNMGSHSASLQFSFEKIYSLAEKTEIWINASDVKTYQELADRNEKYTWFKAFQNKSIYNPIGRQNANSNAIFQEGVWRCDLILKDLISIFNSESYSELYFYKKLK